MTQPPTCPQYGQVIEPLDYFQAGIDMRTPGQVPGSVKVHPGECLRSWAKVHPGGILWAERKDVKK
jgi:hypothetical protein